MLASPRAGAWCSRSCREPAVRHTDSAAAGLATGTLVVLACPQRRSGVASRDWSERPAPQQDRQTGCSNNQTLSAPRGCATAIRMRRGLIIFGAASGPWPPAAIEAKLGPGICGPPIAAADTGGAIAPIGGLAPAIAARFGPGMRGPPIAPAGTGGAIAGPRGAASAFSAAILWRPRCAAACRLRTASPGVSMAGTESPPAKAPGTRETPLAYCFHAGNVLGSAKGAARGSFKIARPVVRESINGMSCCCLTAAVTGAY